MNEHAISWFAIPVADLERARAFYNALLGIDMPDLVTEGGTCAVFPQVETGVSGSLNPFMGFKPTADSGVTIWLNAGEDLQAPLDRVEAAGGKVLQAKQQIGEHGSACTHQADPRRSPPRQRRACGCARGEADRRIQGVELPGGSGGTGRYRAHLLGIAEAGVHEVTLDPEDVRHEPLANEALGGLVEHLQIGLPPPAQQLGILGHDKPSPATWREDDREMKPRPRAQ